MHGFIGDACIQIVASKADSSIVHLDVIFKNIASRSGAIRDSVWSHETSDIYKHNHPERKYKSKGSLTEITT